MQKITVIVLLAAVFVMQIFQGAAYAHEKDSLRAVVVDGLYGGVAGALVGVATMALADKPSEHKENIQIGAGIGVILGTIYGTVKVSRPLAKWEDGKMTAQLPAIQFDLDTAAWKFDILHIAY